LPIFGLDKNREDDCRSPLILKEQVRLLREVFLVLVLFDPIGEWDPITRKEADYGVLLLAGIFQKVLEFLKFFQPGIKEKTQD
jgi:hypothetical protein